MSSTKENWPSVALVRTSGKCSLTWHSGLVGNCYLQLWLKLPAAMTFIKWIRDSWFHFNTFNKNSKWRGGHGHHIPPPPASSSSASPSSPSSSTIGRGTLLVGVASPSTIETFLVSLRGKKREEISLKLY